MINHKEIDPYNEEVWEDEVIIKENNDTIILENVEIRGNFEFLRGLHGQILPGRFDFDSTITFNNTDEKDIFIQKFGYDYRKKLKSVHINNYDKKGFLTETIHLFGVILSSISYGDNNNITIRYDYWEKKII